jgi:hypothetical protein
MENHERFECLGSPDPENAKLVWEALQGFGAPLDTLSLEDLVCPDTVFQIGVSPFRIDILTSITHQRGL